MKPGTDAIITDLQENENEDIKTFECEMPQPPNPYMKKGEKIRHNKDLHPSAITGPNQFKKLSQFSQFSPNIIKIRKAHGLQKRGVTPSTEAGYRGGSTRLTKFSQRSRSIMDTTNTQLPFVENI